ncbi:MAG: TonB-dependent receptor plug domain-containing protein, partial [Bacteroidota bacterium]|nr:TonB-dependent receptor plug domain-containing protein [Bacteroidota bacterium]
MECKRLSAAAIYISPFFGFPESSLFHFKKQTTMSKKLTLLFSAIALGYTAFAQQDSMATRQLNEVVVTATKTPIKASETGKIITIIDHKTIQNNAGSSLAALLNTQAGFFINGSNNALGTNLDLYFRGATGGNMLIVIDGVPVCD